MLSAHTATIGYAELSTTLDLLMKLPKIKSKLISLIINATAWS